VAGADSPADREQLHHRQHGGSATRREPPSLVEEEHGEAGDAQLGCDHQRAAERQDPDAPVAERRQVDRTLGDVVGARPFADDEASDCRAGETRNPQRGKTPADAAGVNHRRQRESDREAADGNRRLADAEREAALLGGKPPHHRAAARGVDARPERAREHE